MSYYSDYFEIDKNYYPVINQNSIKDPANRWQDTYPHKTFISLLESAERMLARGTGADKKGIWVEGAYGTGKSRVLWALGSLLSCSNQELEEYFNKYPDEFSQYSDLRDRLLSHKQNLIITANRYGCSIDTPQKFINAIYETVSGELAKKHLSSGKSSLRKKFAEWIENHPKAFDEAREKSSYIGKPVQTDTIESIVRKLKNLSEPNTYLIENLLEMREAEGWRMMNFEIDDLKSWISEVIDENGLKAIVFIWDEFTPFFSASSSAINIFQSLSELSNEKPFYLVIATHGIKASNAKKGAEGEIAKVSDRFVHKTIEMPDNIALSLMKQAFKVKEGKEDEYAELTEELNGDLSEARAKVCKKAGIEDGILRGVFPIHPIAAYLLKHISENFASNTRSMFNFLKQDESTNDVRAFQWFINNYSPDPSKSDILTIDFLWDFFYEKGADGNAPGIYGRSNLDETIRQILDSYKAFERRLTTKEQSRVLKTVLMMNAINRKTNDSLTLLLPTKANIMEAFKGNYSLDENTAASILDLLKDKKILFIQKTRDGEIYCPVMYESADEAEEKLPSTMDLVRRAKVMEAFSFGKAIESEYSFSEASIDNFTATTNKKINEKKFYQTGCIICYAKDRSEENRMQELLHAASENERCNGIIFIDASSSVIPEDIERSYCEAIKNYKHYTGKDENQADYWKAESENALRDWKRRIIDGEFIIRNHNQAERMPSLQQLKDSMIQKVMESKEFSFVSAKVSDQFFTSSNAQKGAELGIANLCGGIFTTDKIKSLLGTAYNNTEWKNGNTRLAGIKKRVDHIIKKGLKENGRISIRDIFTDLENKGFRPFGTYAYLMGFLLSDYASGEYRYSDESTGGKMTPDKLANIISEYIKNRSDEISGKTSKYRDKYIEIMTPEQNAFAKFACRTFSIEEENSIETIISAMRSRLSQKGYPIWLMEYSENIEIEKCISLLAQVANNDEGKQGPLERAAELGKIFINCPEKESLFEEALNEVHYPEYLNKALEDLFDGEIPATARKIGASNHTEDARRRIGSGDASWLWKKDTGTEELGKLLTEYRIILESANFTAKSSDFESCMEKWQSFASELKMPSGLIKKYVPAVADFIDSLKEIAIKGAPSHESREKFLNILTERHEEIKSLKREIPELIKKHYPSLLKDFGLEEMEELTELLPESSFTSKESAYESDIRANSEKIGATSMRKSMQEIWRDNTGYNSPNEWCISHNAPIWIIVPDEERREAEKLFDILNGGSASNDEIRRCRQYLESMPSFIKTLNDEKTIADSFRNKIIGKNIAVITPEETKKSLYTELGQNPYEWHENAARKTADRLAREKYFKDGMNDVIKEIDGMSPENAKAYLRNLVKNNFDAGIAILSDKKGI